MASTRKAKRSVVEMYGEPDRFLPLLDADAGPADAPVIVKTKVWRWKQDAGWHFATVPKKQSEQIRGKVSGPKRGWGSVPVRIKVGETEWETSLFRRARAAPTCLRSRRVCARRRGSRKGMPSRQRCS